MPDGVAGASLSTVVCWNREVRRLANNYSYRNLANLGLSLSGGTLTETITCDSSLDNVEHIYATDLGPGTYTLTVNESTNVGADFGIAWRVNLSAEKALSATVSSSALDFTDVIEGVTYEVWQSTDLSTWEYVDSFVPTATTHTWSPSTTTGDEVYYRIKYWE